MGKVFFYFLLFAVKSKIISNVKNLIFPFFAIISQTHTTEMCVTYIRFMVLMELN
jgi:hypothetical protein